MPMKFGKRRLKKNSLGIVFNTLISYPLLNFSLLYTCANLERVILLQVGFNDANCRAPLLLGLKYLLTIERDLRQINCLNRIISFFAFNNFVCPLAVEQLTGLLPMVSINTAKARGITKLKGTKKHHLKNFTVNHFGPSRWVYMKKLDSAPLVHCLDIHQSSQASGDSSPSILVQIWRKQFVQSRECISLADLTQLPCWRWYTAAASEKERIPINEHIANHF
ncbi:hypothetical protein EGR_10092 [Echinococcus granulosus]|uniref:Uncharacterized protein n=1 Tax=Echinococcus granulosus TaxID=6210 RepID=W6U982_ECHGR|nr:hypothetical protein EGR_10092 [Echinococcus granulosus]EUB55047.1 hypothetical protein EGR_10092 [Echinococcus granulosus]